MPTLYAEIEINAPQSMVWDALVRKDQWRFWNTFFYDCDPGLQIARGNELFLSMQRLEGDEETEFQPVITMFRPPHVMKWVSTIPGLRSEHTFELRETMPGRTRYIHRETFSGILSKVFLPFIRQDERHGIRRMSQQLKMHVENSVLGDRNNPRYDARYNQPYDPRYDRRYNPQPAPGPYDYPPRSNPPYGDRPYGDRPYSDRPYNDRPYNDSPYYDERRPQSRPSQPPRSYNPDYEPRRNDGYDDKGDYPPRDDYGYRPRRR